MESERRVTVLSELQELRVGAIETPQNIREVTEVDDGLLASIRSQGIIEPLIVRVNHASQRFELVAGFRRFEAAVALGLETVPCRVMDLTDQQVDEMRLVENLQRQDLNHLEQARAIQKLIDRSGLTQAQVGERIGMAQPTVANRLRLLELPETVQDGIRRGILSGSAAAEVLRVKDAPAVLERIGDALAKAGEPPTVQQVRTMVDNAAWNHGHEVAKAILGDIAECKKCGKAIKVYNSTRCFDQECWGAKKAAALAALAQRIRAGETPVAGYDTFPNVLPLCPGDCTNSGLVRRWEGAPPVRACLEPESPCCKARKESMADSQEELRAQREAERKREREEREAELRAREEAEKARLQRVERYLAHRIASNQKGFSRPEMRLVALVVLSDWNAGEYVSKVLGLDGDAGEALAGLSTRELTTLAVGYLLAEGFVGESGTEEVFQTLRDSLIGMEETPEPGDSVEFDAARLTYPEQCEDDEDDGADDQEGEGETPEASAEPAVTDDQPSDWAEDCGGVCDECTNTPCGLHPSHSDIEPHEEARAEAAAAAAVGETTADETRRRFCNKGVCDPDCERQEECKEHTLQQAHAAATAGDYRCPYTRKLVDAAACRSCNDTVRQGGTGCCEYVTGGQAPHTCTACSDKKSCAEAQRRGVA